MYLPPGVELSGSMALKSVNRVLVRHFSVEICLLL